MSYQEKLEWHRAGLGMKYPVSGKNSWRTGDKGQDREFSQTWDVLCQTQRQSPETGSHQLKKGPESAVYGYEFPGGEDTKVSKTRGPRQVGSYRHSQAT